MRAWVLLALCSSAVACADRAPPALWPEPPPPTLAKPLAVQTPDELVADAPPEPEAEPEPEPPSPLIGKLPRHPPGLVAPGEAPSAEPPGAEQVADPPTAAQSDAEP